MPSPLKSTWKTALVLLTTVLGLLATSHAPAAADPSKDVQRAIQAQYDKYCKAQDAKDINGVMAVFAHDFIQTGFETGKTTYTQYRAQMLKQFKSANSMRSHVDIDDISVKGDSATVHIHEGDAVTDLSKSKGNVSYAKIGETLASVTIGDSWRIETWAKRKGVWLLIRSKMGM